MTFKTNKIIESYIVLPLILSFVIFSNFSWFNYEYIRYCYFAFFAVCIFANIFYGILPKHTYEAYLRIERKLANGKILKDGELTLLKWRPFLHRLGMHIEENVDKDA